jgi:hypothetical protein
MTMDLSPLTYQPLGQIASAAGRRVNDADDTRRVAAHAKK